MDVRELISMAGGVADARTLISAGISLRQVQRAATKGWIIRVRRGCYALPNTDPLTLAEVAWNAPATCVSAAARLGLPLMVKDERVHLLFARSRTFSGGHIRPAGHVVVHWSNAPRHDLVEALNQAATCLGREQQLVLIDAALHRGLIAHDDLALLTRGGRKRRDWLTHHAQASAESPLETLTRIALVTRGLPVQSQVVIPRVGRVDFLIGDRLIVEVDGRAYHSDAVQFASDRRRDRAAAAQGYIVLRFTYEEVVHGVENVADEVQTIMARLGVPVRVVK